MIPKITQSKIMFPIITIFLLMFSLGFALTDNLNQVSDGGIIDNDAAEPRTFLDILLDTFSFVDIDASQTIRTEHFRADYTLGIKPGEGEVGKYGGQCGVGEYIKLLACTGPSNNPGTCKQLFDDLYQKQTSSDGIVVQGGYLCGGDCYEEQWYLEAIGAASPEKYVGYDCLVKPISCLTDDKSACYTPAYNLGYTSCKADETAWTNEDSCTSRIVTADLSCSWSSTPSSYECENLRDSMNLNLNSCSPFDILDCIKDIPVVTTTTQPGSTTTTTVFDQGGYTPANISLVCCRSPTTVLQNLQDNTNIEGTTTIINSLDLMFDLVAKIPYIGDLFENTPVDKVADLNNNLNQLPDDYTYMLREVCEAGEITTNLDKQTCEIEKQETLSQITIVAENIKNDLEGQGLSPGEVPKIYEYESKIKGDDKWCIYSDTGVELECHPRKDISSVKDVEDQLDLMTNLELKDEAMDNKESPLCLKRIGDIQCGEGGECLVAKDSDKNRYEDNLIIYEAIDENLKPSDSTFINIIVSSSNAVTEFFSGEDYETDLIENYGACVPKEKTSSIDDIGQTLADLFGTSVEVAWLIVGGTIFFLIIFSNKGGKK